jgi:K+-sensing histidine kinase KdpD
MRKRTNFILQLRPWSPSAFLAALLVIAFAAAMQEVFVSFGATLCFAAFVPAILIASLLAGTPAGLFATLLTIPIVWWAFMPPYFEFNPLTTADYDNFSIFVLASLLAIWFSRLCCEAFSFSRK